MKPQRRTLVAFAAAAFVLLATSAAVAGSTIPKAVATLKPVVSIEGNYILLGDIFFGAGENADKALIHAPAPGRRIVLEANWLYRVARAYGLFWRPTSRYDQVVVERTSHLIDAEQIAEAILSEVQERGGSLRPLEIELDNRLQQILLPTNAHPSISVQSLVVDPRTNRFNATIAAAADQTEAVRVVVAGRIFELVELPVVSRRFRRGEVIEEGDLEWMLVRAETAPRDAIADPNDIVGMSARRPISPHMPLSTNEIELPTVVEKGALVMITLRTPTLLITAKGKAMDKGAIGQSIRVQNTKSKLIFDAIVKGPGSVVVAYQNNTLVR